MKKGINTLESFKNEGFKIERDGKIYTLTPEEVSDFKNFELAVLEENCARLQDFNFYEDVDRYFNIKNGVLLSYTGYEEIVYVPEGVEVIGASCFSYDEKMVKCILPDSLKKIDAFAFDHCYALEEVYLPKDIKAIKS